MVLAYEASDPLQKHCCPFCRSNARVRIKARKQTVEFVGNVFFIFCIFLCCSLMSGLSLLLQISVESPLCLSSLSMCWSFWNNTLIIMDTITNMKLFWWCYFCKTISNGRESQIYHSDSDEEWFHRWWCNWLIWARICLIKGQYWPHV